MENFYIALKAVCGPASSGSLPLFSADDKTLISDKACILNRCSEHFNNALNLPSSINEEVISRPPRVPTDEALEDTPILEETPKSDSPALQL